MDNALGPWCALGSAATWAIGSAGYSQLSKSYSPFSINFSRAFIALPLFILASFISGGISEGISNYQNLRASHWGWFTLSMIASYGLGDSLFLWSTRSLGLPGALAIASCYPIWTALAGYLLLGEKVGRVQTLGILITIAGIVIVVLNGPKTDVQEAKKKVSVSGILLALGTSVAWATNGFAVSRGAMDLHPSVGNTVRMIMALLLCAGFSRIFAPGISLLLPGRRIFRLGWLFVLEAFGGSYLYLYGLSHSSLALGSTLSSLAPVISVPAALAFGLERFSLYRTLGVCVVVFGIWCLLGTF